MIGFAARPLMKKQEKKTGNFEVVIEKLVYGGSGFARHEGKVVFVPFAVPGDRLLVHPVEEKKSFIRAEIIQIIAPGSGRISPICPHFQKCGGCQWQHLDYPRQVEVKKRILEEAFHHRFPQTVDLPIRMQACPQPFAYRSRARIQLRGTGHKACVGFYRPGSHVVENIERCPLFRETLNEALSSVRQYKMKVDTNTEPEEMDIACSAEEDSWATMRTGEPMSQEGITPLFGAKRNEDVVLRRLVRDFTYSVTASVFFQANDFMVSELLTSVCHAAISAGQGKVLDLYSGVGLFSLPLARQFQTVIAVENSQPATRLCTRNAAAAELRNIQVVCKDVTEWLRAQPESARGSFDLIVLDPPRTGAGPEVMKRISELAPPKIIYVSCDPQTLVRDLAAISPRTYSIAQIEGLDLFPQTYHFETVVRLSRIDD